MVLTKGQHFKKHIQKARDMRKSQAHISGSSTREMEIQGTESNGRKLQQQRSNTFSSCPSQRFIYPGTTMDSIFDQLSIQEFQSAAQAVVSHWIQVTHQCVSNILSRRYRFWSWYNLIIALFHDTVAVIVKQWKAAQIGFGPWKILRYWIRQGDSATFHRYETLLFVKFKTL